MLNDLLSPLIPHIQSAADVCNQWAERICARLDGIHMAVLSEDFEENRQRILTNLSPTAGRSVVGEVPGGEEWLLENWSVNLTAAGPFIIRSDDEPIFAKTPAAAQDSGGGNGLLVSGRTTLTVESVGASAGRVYLQWRRRLPTPINPRRFGAGHQDPIPQMQRVLSPPNEHNPAFPLDKTLTR